MVAYEYGCIEHGQTEFHASMGTAPASIPCPQCGGPSRRIFTAPRFGVQSKATPVIERAERSSEQPDVVTSIPRPNEY